MLVTFHIADSRNRCSREQLELTGRRMKPKCKNRAGRRAVDGESQTTVARKARRGEASSSGSVVSFQRRETTGGPAGATVYVMCSILSSSNPGEMRNVPGTRYGYTGTPGFCVFHPGFILELL